MHLGLPAHLDQDDCCFGSLGSLSFALHCCCSHILLHLRLRSLPSDETQMTREMRFVSSIVEVTQEDLDAQGGVYKVTLEELFKSTPFEVINADSVIFTITKPMTKQVDCRVGFGRGYVPSERHQIPNKLSDEIVIDTSFSLLC